MSNDITQLHNKELAKRLKNCLLLNVGYDHDEVITEAIYRLSILPNWARPTEVNTKWMYVDHTKNIACCALQRMLLRHYPLDSEWQIILNTTWGPKEYTIESIDKLTHVIRVRSVASGYVFPFKPSKHPHRRIG